jgi:hypothetical protein
LIVLAKSMYWLITLPTKPVTRPHYKNYLIRVGKKKVGISGPTATAFPTPPLFPTRRFSDASILPLRHPQIASVFAYYGRSCLVLVRFLSADETVLLLPTCPIVLPLLNISLEKTTKFIFPLPPPVLPLELSINCRNYKEG